MHHEEWESTDRNTDNIVAEALKERLSIADDDPRARAASWNWLSAAYPWWLLNGSLPINFGDAQADRRTPGDVRQCGTIHGVHQPHKRPDFGSDGQQTVPLMTAKSALGWVG